MKAVIMAGGRGTRISSMTSSVPKPMIPIEGKPVLEHEILCLREQGFTDLIITVSHLSDVIMKYFGNGSRFGVKIQYFYEELPLGNAGALFKIRECLEDDFLLINGDAVFFVDFERFVKYHKSKGGLVTLFTHPNNHPYDSGLIVADENKCVNGWLTKEDERPRWYKNRVNAGLHVVNPAILDMTEIDRNTIGTTINGAVVKVDLDRQILKPLCGTGKMFCYDSPEYIKDMGTPERYEMVCRDYISGKLKARNLLEKQKAIFLDRDGTINQYVGFLRNIDDFQLLPNVTDAVRRINESGYLTIVVTNQPVLARGEISVRELDLIHNKMETLLGNEGAFVDAIFYCPHHPDKGFDGEILELKIDCDCRKPKPGMLKRAAQEFNIDLENSWMIGDSESDILAGRAAGCRTVLLGKEEYGQNWSADNLLDAVNLILSAEQ